MYFCSTNNKQYTPALMHNGFIKVAAAIPAVKVADCRYNTERIEGLMARAEGLGVVPVAVNLSRVTLRSPSLPASILAIQSRYPEVSADQIHLEITETAWDVENSTLSSVVDKFKNCGIGFELDDFGSRYANVSMFTNIKFKTIKLDRSLVDELADNEISKMLVRDIAGICRKFGMDCIAEGVENEDQVNGLLEAGCIYGQGFYYDRPMTPQRFEAEYLRNTKGR